MSDISLSEDEDESGSSEVLHTKFNKAADFIQKQHSNLEQDILLQLYGLYKQVTSGKCDSPKPSIFNFQAKAKWEAWNKLQFTSKEECMQKYIEIVEKLGADLEEISNSSGNKTKTQWVCHSVPLIETQDTKTDSCKTIFDYVKEENLEKVKIFVNADNVNQLDETGIGIIHWAADRNSLDILEYIIEHCSANINLRDTEQQTALHYASSCGHNKCVEFLLKHGANKELSDDAGQTSLDVAFDESVKSLILSFQ
ncbi:acyl-CoA-binding domain-containing protein 6-like [Condylostylus longicornis]|uniref:acyl-CoA-binding domain-containing protein 6-like n=1 Tax=Condylostylus longicornis TaxID=2530218 RepID=UPI00244DF5F1|nr:acyl-CoA-binding domain-containing protein 6-like [Condylostylus longicornis]